MKVAIIGLGTMGWMYASRLARMDGIQLAGAYDRSAAKAEAFSSQYGTRVFDTFEQLMTEGNPDVVCITLPTFLHKEYVLKTARLGKHVICEKPLAVRPEDAAEMVQACEKQQVKLFVCHVARFFPENQNLKKTIESGQIGKIGIAHAKRAGTNPSLASSWYSDETRSGGIIMDLMIHDIDLMRWMIGDIRSVYTMSRRSSNVHVALVTLQFHNDAVANIEAYWGYPGPFTTAVEIAGSGGVIFSDNQSTQPYTIQRMNPSSDVAEAIQVPGDSSLHDPYFAELSHFLTCIRTGDEPIITTIDAVKAVEIAAAAILSGNTGLPVTI
ncbi:Gfo/Idh/MocA family protein [Paenibacillus nasutitermitis]|uniref:Dehydrogenase n=1 Tax=Paenibacillus nasutitermitis TaxID=1652958 RepID=A0A916YMJ1_9BACL|nr:Gfo/Idh/MocA family oxidoreductase [Paenibacillus nasutitermitis]GGD51001.1 dehydrogenase [Paenibacillus nasutitermitis]